MFVAGILGATGVAIGAFQAHGLEKLLVIRLVPTEDISHRLELCSTGVRFQLIHALALIVISIVSFLRPTDRIWRAVGIGFCIGLLFFCGSLYMISIAGKQSFAKFAPIGGVTLMASWFMVSIGAFCFSPAEQQATTTTET